MIVDPDLLQLLIDEQSRVFSEAAGARAEYHMWIELRRSTSSASALPGALSLDDIMRERAEHHRRAVLARETWSALLVLEGFLNRSASGYSRPSNTGSA